MKPMSLVPIAGLASVALVGCGGKMKLDGPTVEERLDRIEATVPLCTTPTTSAASAARSVSKPLADLSRMARVVAAAGPRLPDSGLRTNGGCGGTLSATWEHDNGITDYLVDFAGYCLQSPDGDVVVDGLLAARQIGKPSDAGPVISAFEVETDGPIALTHAGATIELELDGARTEYGYPETWSPGIADEDHPDVTTVKYGSAVHVDGDGREDFVRDVRIERTGAAPATIVITKGETGTVGEGYVDMVTAEDDPLTVDAAAVRVTGGTLELHGSGGTVVTVSPDPAEAGAFELTLDGVPYTRSVDCSEARGPLVEAGLALLLEIPIL